MQPQVHLVDETWIDAPPATVSAVVCDPASWRLWWPYLRLTVTRDRGLKGVQFAAEPAPGSGWPALAGTVEIWLEPFKTGVLLHHFLRLESTSGEQLSGRAARRWSREAGWHAKQVFWRLKDELESGS
ncbi:MAG: polyketide cyclase / dehydrase and lipid transport [Jatrophihabitantaceae bacterium]